LRAVEIPTPDRVATEVVRGRYVGGWMLNPWREQLAGLFEGVDFRPFLGGVRHVRVAGPDRPRSLLAGWLVSRLRLAHGAVELRVADQASVEVVAEHDGRMGRFAVGRPAGAPRFRAGVEIEGGPAHARTLPLRDRSRSDVFARALAPSEADTVYEEVLAAAIALSRKGRT